jgi:hypothetical protein
MKKLFLICAMVAALACINVMPAQATISLEFNPSDIEVPVCSTFFVNLLADIPQEDAILGWGLDLVYDSTQMSWDFLIIGPKWMPPLPGTTDDGFGGLLPFGETDPVFGEEVLLATLDFHCLGLGFSKLELAVSDATEGFVLPNGDFAEWSYSPANISQTPEPATLFLVGTGLAGIATARRRKKKL